MASGVLARCPVGPPHMLEEDSRSSAPPDICQVLNSSYTRSRHQVEPGHLAHHLLLGLWFNALNIFLPSHFSLDYLRPTDLVFRSIHAVQAPSIPYLFPVMKTLHIIS